LESFKYINNISPEVAEIRIYKRIGSTYDEMGNYVPGVNGSDFANEMAYLQGQTNQINIRINSGGGSILDAMAIQASILNSKVPVHTYNDGIAASAAASIALSGQKFFMADNAMLMIHNAIDTKGGTPDRVMEVFNDSVATFLSNRMNKGKEDVRKMMEKETWMNAKECSKMGIVDEIVSTKKKIKTPKVTNVFELEKIYNEYLTKNPNMEKINNELGLQNGASEEASIAAIKALKNELETTKSTLETVKNENTSLKKEKADAIEAEKLALKTDVEKFANQLVADKKIKEEEKAGVIENASASRSSFDFVKKIYEKISDVKEPKKIFDPAKVANETGGEEDRSKWTFNDWSKKDPKGLEKLQNEHPEVFNALVSKIDTSFKTKK
jgi:ATP-dependent Clp protease, protease subunit